MIERQLEREKKGKQVVMGKNLYKSIMVRLPPDLAESLEVFCAKGGESQTGVIREAIRQYLEQQSTGLAHYSKPEIVRKGGDE